MRGRRFVLRVDAARDCGLAAVSANDHFIFSTHWPLGDERRQIELVASEVAPQIERP